MYAKYTYKNLSLTPSIMTSNTTPLSDVIVSSSSKYNDSYAAWNAFDGPPDAGSWITVYGTVAGWLRIDYKSPIQHYYYTVGARNQDVVSAPKNWTYEGSNNGVDWATIDTRINQTGWGATEKRTYTIASPGNYSSYRLNITANNGQVYTAVSSFEAWDINGVINYNGLILSDVVAILTGETNVNNLSILCDKSNSYILNTVTNADWTIHDASAGTNAVCLKTRYWDDPSRYIYVVVDTNTYGWIYTKLYESWDAVTHTGTNLAVNSDANVWSQKINVAKGGMLYMVAASTHMCMYAYQNSTWGTASYNSPSGIFQRTRKSPWDTIITGYPTSVFINFAICFQNNGNVYATRIKPMSGTDLTGSNAYFIVMTAFSTQPIASPTTPLVDGDNLAHSIQHIGLVNPTSGLLGGDMSTVCDVWLTTSSYGGNLDEIVFNDKTYVIWACNAYRIAVRKG